MLTSVDDFYTAYTSPLRGSTACACSENAEGNAGGGGGVGGRLVVMETSLDVHKASLYDLITPTSLLSWVRVRSANLMARDGAEWSRRFSYDHSGTYANQWMVLDMARFQPASGEQAAQLSDGLLTIVEEMPGMISGSDQTTHLQSTSYWASYNQVFDEELSAYSGSTEFCETTRAEYQERIASGEVPRHDIRTYGDLPGELNCYHTSSRANLFAGLQGSVESVF
ncbi:plbG, partial [Symbiodinium microadriaticum]